MKTLIVVNGTMGGGKTTLCEKLNKQLSSSVWLDGDWCWMMNPWVFSEENKAMVIENIGFLLRNYLKNSGFDYVLFSWVIHQDAIWNLILQQISDLEFELIRFSLVCDNATLEQRLIQRGDTPDVIRESLGRLSFYEEMDSVKIDTANSIDENLILMMNKITERKRV